MKKYTLFPNIEDVFIDVTDNHKAVFFPLLTVDLKAIDKGNGKLHFVSYFRNGEPDNISDANFAYNFMKFKIVGDKYKFNGDFSKIYLFEKSIKWHKEALQIYKDHKKEYMSNSDFVKAEDNRRMAIDFEYYYYIKGVLNYWVTRDKFIETSKFIQGSAYTYNNSDHIREPFEQLGGVYDDEGYVDEILEETLTELKMDLKDLNFIGSLAGYNYLEFGADEIVLFLNDENTEVFQYYNWS